MDGWTSRIIHLVYCIIERGKCVFPMVFTAAFGTHKSVRCMMMAGQCEWVSPLSLSHIRDVIINTSPPTKPGAPQTRIFINRHLSLLAPTNPYDQVYPGILLGDKVFARDKAALVREGVTHLINAAEGHLFHQVDTTDEFYSKEGIKYLGIRAMDTARFKMEQHFHTAADFIDQALANGGTVGVHCVQGMSRSAALVIAYLMLKQGMRLPEAITALRQKRAIFPNDGFLKQLITLDHKLYL